MISRKKKKDKNVFGIKTKQRAYLVIICQQVTKNNMTLGTNWIDEESCAHEASIKA